MSVLAQEISDAYSLFRHKIAALDLAHYMVQSECLWDVDKIVSAPNQADEPLQSIIVMKSFKEIMTNPDTISLTPRIRERLFVLLQESKGRFERVEWIVNAISGAIAFTSDEQIQSATLSILNVGYGTEISKRIRSDCNFS